MRAVVAALALAVAAMTATPVASQVLRFADLDGWAQDDHIAALTTFRETCALLKDPDWVPLCNLAADAGNTPQSARQFFELFFKPVLIGDPPALFTGYYEPELDGSPVRTPRFAWPIYRRPPELQDGQVYHTRAAADWNWPGWMTRLRSIFCRSKGLDEFGCPMAARSAWDMPVGMVMPIGRWVRKWCAVGRIRWIRCQRRKSGPTSSAAPGWNGHCWT